MAVAADSRLCTRFATAFIETVVRDRFVRRREREIALNEITGGCWARISGKPGIEMTLLDLRGDGCARRGAPTDAVRARNQAAGRALARAIHDEHAEIEGLLYVSPLPGEDVYGVFARGAAELEPSGTGVLAEHPELPEIMDRHGIGLIP